MKVQVTTSAGLVTASALLYAFPRKGNAPEGFTLTLNGEAVETRMTGGGKYPQYVYFLGKDKVSRYLPKNIIPVSGSDIVELKDAAKPVPAKEQLANIEDRGPEGIDDLRPMDETNEVLKHILSAIDVPAKKKRVPRSK